jgi:hypothetical protein
MRYGSFAPVTLAVAALLTPAPSPAGTIGESFAVGITLSQGSEPPSPPPSGLCLSHTLSEQTRASVVVVCRSGQFVSIAPLPGVPYLGVHGGAFRYSIGFHTEPFLWDGPGTVTALRLYDLSLQDRPLDAQQLRLLEMLVSF